MVATMVFWLLRRVLTVRRRCTISWSAPKETRPVKNPPAKPAQKRELAQAPIGRTVGFMLLGFVVMIAGVASLSM